VTTTNVFSWISSCPHDKAMHLIIGASLACLGALVTPMLGVILCATGAMGKEIYDKVSGKGNPEWLDCFATLAGGCLVLLPLFAHKAF
jgi:hypothetical protein